VEQALVSRKFCLGVFFDIEGAFDKAPLMAIETSMNRKGVPRAVTNWICSLVKNRKVKLEHNDEEVTRRVHTGIPQGGVLSPLLWALLVDSLLCDLQREANQNVHYQFYADDGTILVTGSSLRGVCGSMQKLLNIANR
jgi:hypothetical protein